MGQSAVGPGGMHGFASALTSFVGRAEAIREVTGLLEERRLVTVTGPGGSGKSRLAGEVARRVADRFADGVWLVELVGVRDEAQVAAVVAVALGVLEHPGMPVSEALARALAAQQLLLVLDNCEHVIDAAAQLCAGLLGAADDVRVLTTSREPLRVAGEARYRLAPLPLPDPDDLADAAHAEAVALFADRARHADTDFALDDKTVPTVGRLVTRLDGMPLAIELAAARVEALGVTQLLDRIDDRFALLTSGDRLAAGRHRSLAATVEWSYRLLDERERRIFRWISVFPGPFTLEAADAVAGEGSRPAVLNLVECSLLVPPREDPDGRFRYAMLETLRAYGARLLAEAGEQEQAAAALAAYALEVSEQAAAVETSTEGAAAGRWLDAEDATTRQALAWAILHDPATALRLAVALSPWWIVRGRAPGGAPLLREAAEYAAPGSDLAFRAQFWLGEMALYAADLSAALAHLNAVLDAVAAPAPSRTLADCLGGRSLILANLGRIAEAADDSDRALAMALKLGYPAGQAQALVGRSVAALNADDPAEAVRLARQADQIPADIPNWIAHVSSAILTLALVGTGDLAEAEQACAAGLERARRAGDLVYQASMLAYMANLDTKGGRHADAAAHLWESLQLAVRIGSQFEVLNGLDACGYLCAATGRAADAVTVWAAHAALSRQEGLVDPPSEERSRAEPLRAARHALGKARARAAEDRGAAMSLATAAEYALMLTAPGPTSAEPPELGGLSARERELVTLVARGRTDAQIAAELFISVHTVRSYLERIRDKTGARRRADLTRLALATGLV